MSGSQVPEIPEHASLFSFDVTLDRQVPADAAASLKPAQRLLSSVISP